MIIGEFMLNKIDAEHKKIIDGMQKLSVTVQTALATYENLEEELFLLKGVEQEIKKNMRDLKERLKQNQFAQLKILDEILKQDTPDLPL